MRRSRKPLCVLLAYREFESLTLRCRAKYGVFAGSLAWHVIGARLPAVRQRTSTNAPFSEVRSPSRSPGEARRHRRALGLPSVDGWFVDTRGPRARSRLLAGPGSKPAAPVPSGPRWQVVRLGVPYPAHNPKVAGSNPAPAMKEGPGIQGLSSSRRRLRPWGGVQAGCNFENSLARSERLSGWSEQR